MVAEEVEVADGAKVRLRNVRRRGVRSVEMGVCGGIAAVAIRRRRVRRLWEVVCGD